MAIIGWTLLVWNLLFIGLLASTLHLAGARNLRLSPGDRVTHGSSPLGVLSRGWSVVAFICALLFSPFAANAVPIPVTGDKAVNTTNASGQLLRSATAMDAIGNTVVVWESGAHVYAQRFDLSGTSLGVEIQVSVTPPGGYSSPDVAMDGSGNFVVTWQQYGMRVFAQRFSSTGTKLGDVLVVDQSESACLQFYPPAGCFRYSGNAAVASDAQGNFVVVYAGLRYGDGVFVFMKRFDGAGVALDVERVLVNDMPAGSSQVDVARNGSGTFVVAWQDSYAGYDDDIWAQRFDASGARAGNKFMVNADSVFTQQDPAVGIDASGNFVIAWTSFGQEDPLDSSTLSGIYAQRFNSAGSRVGNEFQVNTYMVSYQVYPDLAMGSDGRFVVTWQSYGQEDPTTPNYVMYGIYAQAYKSNGFKDGNEFHVNVDSPYHQRYPAIAVGPANALVISWFTEAGDVPEDPDILARWYDFPDTPGICSGLPQVGFCGTELRTLCNATEGAASLAPKDMEMLVGKVFDAVDKINQNKYSDAGQKLSDFSAKLSDLERAAKPKISRADADAIHPPLKAAQSCVRKL